MNTAQKVDALIALGVVAVLVGALSQVWWMSLIGVITVWAAAWIHASQGTEE